ncbi:hypothetical protein PVAND_006899 [Polypedilum vanderplanki]|uniref:Small integral membrane protein 14 n=1 Tax=Polypedilum vanderplanki TaxID=319348 RepID=A0A9J6C4L0_POLVA|nr:hypothetical protein PVAND_006899 [Polypedilum vanderplanki]
MNEDMGDMDMDLCQCIFSNNFAMRRLLNLLRNGQSVCTDSECFDLVQPQASGNNTGSDTMDNFTFMIFMFIAAVILYLIRPNSLRRRTTEAKSSRDDDSSNGEGNNGPMVN